MATSTRSKPADPIDDVIGIADLIALSGSASLLTTFAQLNGGSIPAEVIDSLRTLHAARSKYADASSALDKHLLEHDLPAPHLLFDDAVSKGYLSGPLSEARDLSLLTTKAADEVSRADTIVRATLLSHVEPGLFLGGLRDIARDVSTAAAQMSAVVENVSALNRLASAAGHGDAVRLPRAHALLSTSTDSLAMFATDVRVNIDRIGG